MNFRISATEKPTNNFHKVTDTYYHRRTTDHRTFRHNHLVTRTIGHKDIWSQDISSQDISSQDISSQDISSQDISSHGHFVTGHFVTGHFVTGHFVTRTFRHRISSLWDDHSLTCGCYQRPPDALGIINIISKIFNKKDTLIQNTKYRILYSFLDAEHDGKIHFQRNRQMIL